jgi:hypothetical protein
MKSHILQKLFEEYCSLHDVYKLSKTCTTFYTLRKKLYDDEEMKFEDSSHRDFVKKTVKHDMNLPFFKGIQTFYVNRYIKVFRNKEGKALMWSKSGISQQQIAEDKIFWNSYTPKPKSLVSPIQDLILPQGDPKFKIFVWRSYIKCALTPEGKLITNYENFVDPTRKEFQEFKEIQALDNIEVILPNFYNDRNAFALLTKEGSVYAFGDRENGGEIPKDIKPLEQKNNIKMIQKQFNKTHTKMIQQ